jgi:uncharacterized protein
MLCAVDRAVASPKQIAVVGRFGDSNTQALLRTVFEPYIPNKAVAGAEPGDLEAERDVPLLEERTSATHGPLVYVCENFVCQVPSGDPELVRELLKSGAS